jgi:hypothetical protein
VADAFARREMTDPRRSAPPADHPAHDPLLVAAAADRGGQLPAALADCHDCRALHADLLALAAAVPHAALPARPRAYTLTPTDAARLRPAGWRRWLAAIGTSRDAVTRPLALGLTTLGIAGLLVATVPGALPFAGSASSAPASVPSPAVDTAAGAASTPAAELGPVSAPSAAPVAEVPAMAPSAAPSSRTAADLSTLASPAATDDDAVFSGSDQENPAASAAGGLPADAKASNEERLDAARGSGLSPVALVAAALLVVGLGLFGLRWGARRGFDG